MEPVQESILSPSPGAFPLRVLYLLLLSEEEEKKKKEKRRVCMYKRDWQQWIKKAKGALGWKIRHCSEPTDEVMRTCMHYEMLSI